MIYSIGYNDIMNECLATPADKYWNVFLQRLIDRMIEVLGFQNSSVIIYPQSDKKGYFFTIPDAYGNYGTDEGTYLIFGITFSDSLSLDSEIRTRRTGVLGLWIYNNTIPETNCCFNSHMYSPTTFYAYNENYPSGGGYFYFGSASVEFAVSTDSNVGRKIVILYEENDISMRGYRFAYTAIGTDTYQQNATILSAVDFDAIVEAIKPTNGDTTTSIVNIADKQSEYLYTTILKYDSEKIGSSSDSFPRTAIDVYTFWQPVDIKDNQLYLFRPCSNGYMSKDIWINHGMSSGYKSYGGNIRLFDYLVYDDPQEYDTWYKDGIMINGEEYRGKKRITGSGDTRNYYRVLFKK